MHPPCPDIPFPAGIQGKLARLGRAVEMLNRLSSRDWSPDGLIELAETGRRIERTPERAPEELAALQRRLPGAIGDIARRTGDRTLINRALAHICK